MGEVPDRIVGESAAAGNSIIDTAPDAGLQRMKVEMILRIPVLFRFCTRRSSRKQHHETLRREVDDDDHSVNSCFRNGLPDERGESLLRFLPIAVRLRRVRVRELLRAGRLGRLLDMWACLLAVRRLLLALRRCCVCAL
jgi:hypothetical protein